MKLMDKMRFHIKYLSKIWHNMTILNFLLQEMNLFHKLRSKFFKKGKKQIKIYPLISNVSDMVIK